MGDYDINFKNIFDQEAEEIVWRLLSEEIVGNVSSTLFLGTPRFADAIYRTSRGPLLHIEFQSSNDPTTGWRMVNYRTAIDFQQYKWKPSVSIRQIVLYFGQHQCTMPNILEGERIRFGYEVHDIRKLINGGDVDLEGYLGPNIRVLVLLGSWDNNFGEWEALIEDVCVLQDETERSVLLIRIEILAGLRGIPFQQAISRRIEEMALQLNVEHTTIARGLVEEGIRNEILRTLVPEITVAEGEEINDLVEELRVLSIDGLRFISDQVRRGADFWQAYNQVLDPKQSSFFPGD